MRRNLRKPIGLTVLLFFLVIYILAAVALAPVILPDDARILAIAYFVVAGVAWVVPAALLISWMEKAD